MENTNELHEEVYSYQVNTRMPIMGLSIGILKVPATVKLTKEDVLICVKKAPVFRRFATDDKERVGIGNIDRLHRAEHLTEKEYEALVDKENDNRGKVSEAPVEEKKETVELIVQTTPEENIVEEQPIINEKVNEVENVSEEVNEESAEVETQSTEENKYRNNHYNNKKKHNR